MIKYEYSGTSDIGKRIRARRKELGLTQSELAKRMGYTDKSSISRLEKGDYGVSSKNLDRLAKALQTTIPYLVGGESEPDLLEGLVSVSKKGHSSVLADINKDFAIGISDTSMKQAGIDPGDYVIVRKQPVQSGDLCAVKIDGHPAIRRFIHNKEFHLIVLRAENPEYRDLYFDEKDLANIDLLGKAVSVEKLLR